MSNHKTIISALLVMLLWGTLFPMVKLGYTAYNIVTAGDILYFAGVVTINAGADGISFNIGDVLIIAASFCTVISNIISKRVFAMVKPVTSTGVSQLFGGVVLLSIGRLADGSMSFGSGGSAFVMIYICTASIISYCIWYTTVKNGQLSKLFIIKFAEPMFACIAGALILNENIFRLKYLAAFLLIAGGIYISSKYFTVSST